MSAVPFPQYIEFQTASRCNARCLVCPMSWTADGLPHGRMADELIGKIISELGDHAAELISVEPYFNNEPFMDRRYLKVLRDIRSAIGRCSVEISTNGALLRPELSDKILSERLVDDFRISFFGGDRETYERVMHKLSWDKTVENIEYYAKRWFELGKPNLSRIVYVQNSDLQQVDDLDRLRARWEPYGLGFIHWQQLDRAGNVPYPRRQQLLRSRQGTIRNCKMGYMRDRIAITYDGTVYLCCQDWSRSVLIGSVGNKSIAELWAGDARKKHYRQIYGEEIAPPDHICRGCELATIDGGVAHSGDLGR